MSRSRRCPSRSRRWSGSWGPICSSRARGNIALTDAGEALLPLARRILADAETARHEVQELVQLRRGRVRLGATPSLCTGLLPRRAARLPRPLSRASGC